mgnify:CR=1 FL=1
MQVIPALDLLGDDVVRLHQGSYDDVLFRLPLDTVLDRVLDEGPALLHVVDLQGARDGRFRTSLLERILTRTAGFVPVQASGGLRSVESARDVLDHGAARVIVGTAAWEDGALPRFVGALGDQLVVALDIKDGTVAVRGWVGSSGLSLEEALERCLVAGVVRLHVTAVERDGTMRGPDLDLYRRACASGIAVVAAGGVRDEADVAALEALGCEAAVMGVGWLTRVGLLP